jgi:hypothetical protein
MVKRPHIPVGTMDLVLRQDLNKGLVLPDPSCDPPVAHGIFVFVIGDTAHLVPPARNLFDIKS